MSYLTKGPPPHPQGSNLGPCCWERGVLATGPPGKSLNHRSGYYCIIPPFVSIVTGMGLPSSPLTPSSLLSLSACPRTPHYTPPPRPLTCSPSWLLLLLSPSSLLPGARHRSPAPLQCPGCDCPGTPGEMGALEEQARPRRGASSPVWKGRPGRVLGRLWPACPARQLVSWPRWAVVPHAGSPHSHCLQPKP